MSARLTSVRPFAWAWLIYTIAILSLAASLWIPSGLYKEMDFRSLYAAGVLVRTDATHLYDLSRQRQVQDSRVARQDQMIPFGHLAFDALLYIPLSLLNYRDAYLSIMLCNALLIIFCFMAAREELSEMLPLWQPRAGLIFFTFMPTTIAVVQGQDSLLLLLILCLTWRLLGRSQHFAAGVVLATMLLKPHLALLMALFLAVRYGWRLAAGFAVGSAGVISICLPFMRHGGWRAWLGVLSNLSLASGNNQAQETAMGIYSWAMPNVRGALLFVFGRLLSSRELFALVCMVSLIVVLCGLVVVRKLTPKNAFAFSVVVTILVSYNFEPHDLVILLLPMVLIEEDASRALRLCRYFILGLPIFLLIFAPSTPPGAGLTLLCVPLFASALILSRAAPAPLRTQEVALA
jgi:hypothetical protein